MKLGHIIHNKLPVLLMSHAAGKPVLRQAGSKCLPNYPSLGVSSMKAVLPDTVKPV